MYSDALIEQSDVLFARRSVKLAYLFGSQATGHTHAESDVDCAVLVGESLTHDDRFELRMDLIGELSRVCRTDNVDVVILNEASPLLCFEVLRNGVLLYCFDEDTRIEFQVRTVREYEDTAPLRKVLAEAMAERIRTNTFGQVSGFTRPSKEDA